jgi:putative transcriptional regulator
VRREKLIELRVQKGWLQEDVAKKLGITTSFYGMIEQGVRTPRIPLALAMEELFGVPVKELFLNLHPTKRLVKTTKPPQPARVPRSSVRS